MSRILAFLMVIISGWMIAGCGNADYTRNKDGLIYRIVHSGKGDLIKHRTYLKVHQEVRMDDT
ncbi:MAG TPA: hypothetical protein VK907_12580, partial [Phnomibacter sp.]|nr:hypothetical protein [Phnomibacter sp.]